MVFEEGGHLLFGVVPQSRVGLRQPSRPCFHDLEDLHPTHRRKTAIRLSFPPPRLYDLEWKGCLSYGLCLGQTKNKNAIQPRCVRDVKEDCLLRMCGEFRGSRLGNEVDASVCVFAAGVVSRVCVFFSNHHYVPLNR